MLSKKKDDRDLSTKMGDLVRMILRNVGLGHTS